MTKSRLDHMALLLDMLKFLHAANECRQDPCIERMISLAMQSQPTSCALEDRRASLNNFWHQHVTMFAMPSLCDQQMDVYVSC